MYWKLEGNLLMVRLQTGEKILEKLRDAAKSSGLISGVVLSGIGMLKEVELGYFQGLEKGYQRHFIPFPCELVSLSGSISKQEDDFNIHLHACLIKLDGDSTGGHLFDGIVQYTNEIFILSLNLPLLRRKEDTGLYGLYFE